MSFGVSNQVSRPAWEKEPHVNVGHLPVPGGKGRPAQDQVVKGQVTHTGLTKAQAETAAKTDGSAFLGAHSAIRKDEDGTYSVLRIDTDKTPVLKQARDVATIGGGIAGIMVVHDKITSMLKSSAKADPGFTFID